MALPGRTQGVRDDDVEPQASGARPDPPEHPTGIAALIARVMALRPVRVFLHYSTDNGQLIASGMTYQAFFALAAALWFAFSVFGFVLAGNTGLQQQVFAAINSFLPRLIAYDSTIAGGTTIQNPGAIQGKDLIGTVGLSVSGIVSLVGVLFTAVGFLGTLRTAIRIMFALPALQTNFAIQKLKDLGLTVAFGAVVLLTAVISLVANTAIGLLFQVLGLGHATAVQTVLTTVVAFVVLAGIETGLLAGAFRILSGIPIPGRRLWQGAVIGGVALALLQTLGTKLLGSGTSNPGIKIFAVLIGVLVFLNIVCQLILIAASWVAVAMADAGVDARALDPAQREQQKAAELEDARRLVADANREALEQRVRAAHGLTRLRLARTLKREVRAEARRREQVPTEREYAKAQRASADLSPDAEAVDTAD